MSTSFGWEGKDRYGSFRQRINAECASKTVRSWKRVPYLSALEVYLRQDTRAFTLKPRPHQQHVEATCRMLPFDMSNVAVRHVAVFGDMSNDFFILSTCRNKLNMFNFFRHVERRMPQVACCFDMLLRHVAGVDGAVRHVECRLLQVACCFDMLLVWTGLRLSWLPREK